MEEEESGKGSRVDGRRKSDQRKNVREKKGCSGSKMST